MQTNRRTLIVHGRLAMRERRLEAARGGAQGLQIMTFEQAAARLAGGFIQPIDDAVLRDAVQEALVETSLGELEAIKTLPGMVGAAADSLRKVWRADLDLSRRSKDHSRLAALAQLEGATLARIPHGMRRPGEIAAAAMARIRFAPAVLGELEIDGLTELSPVWRGLLTALADIIPVRWIVGPREAPNWLKGTRVRVVTAAAATPSVSVESAATAYHEAIEAMRWVRRLLASGVAAHDIAIAAASTVDHDDHFLALSRDANLDLHFVHGVKVVATREGQAAAALADIVLRGLTQARLRRLASLCGDAKPFADVQEGWRRVLPRDVPLSDAAAWKRLLDRLTPEDWPDKVDHTPALRALVERLSGGPAAAEAMGEEFLTGRALSIWRAALAAGPAASLDATLETLRADDGIEASVNVVWTPASALAAAPRAHVRLIGLNSSRWPRGLGEDRLIPDHVIAIAELDPLPVNLADRRDFDSILKTTASEVVLCRARRGTDGRLLGRSPLLAEHGPETYLRRNRTPEAAFSETDRLTARPDEFRGDAQARSAAACWADWRKPEITRHDGRVRTDHPLILRILERTQSANSLKRLLRNPLGFVWTYAFHWKAPDSVAESLTLDALARGSLLHETLDDALLRLESAGGFAAAKEVAIAQAIAQAARDVAARWEIEAALPPAVIWRSSLDDMRGWAMSSLTFGGPRQKGARCFGEVAFGGAERRGPVDAGRRQPWDVAARVDIPGTGFAINGFIDRLEIAADGGTATVIDYKTGRAPNADIRLNGGAELQRCLYAFAVKALLGEKVKTRASLFYPRDDQALELTEPEAALEELTAALVAARKSLAEGVAVPGIDTGGGYDDLAFALPANAGVLYCVRKRPGAIKSLGDAVRIWEAQ